MIRLPYRQVYGRKRPSFGRLFAARVAIADIREWPGYLPIVASPENGRDMMSRPDDASDTVPRP